MARRLFETVLAATVHEMKNSLSLLLNQIDELGAELPAASADKLSPIRYEASRINTALMEMLALYRLDNRQLDVSIEEVVMVDFIEDCLVTFLPLARSRQIDITIDCDTLQMGFFDANLVGIAITNILGNSIRYAKAAIRITVFREDSRLGIRIEDDGDGYPEALLDEANGNGHGIDMGTGSTGLGIFFARSLAGCHQRDRRQGEIRLGNGAGLSGGCFEILLP